MPFFENTGVHTEEHRGPFLRAFSIMFDQVERMVVLNITWALQILPLAAFFAFPQLPLWLRVVFLLYTGSALIPATGMLFRLAARAQTGKMLRLQTALDELKATAGRSYLVLAPLYSLFAWLAALAWLSQANGLLILDVAARLGLLFCALFAVYWGPLFAESPQRSAWAVLRESVRLVWRAPGKSLAAALVVSLLWLLATFSIGGLVLAAPALAALMQTGYHAAAAGEKRPSSID